MSTATPALIAAAAGVGFAHAILPDHWLALALAGRARGYPLRRLARLSGLAGLTHVLVSLLLGGVIVAVGLQVRSTVEHAQNLIVGSVLLLTGLALLVAESRGHGHHHDHDHGAHRHGAGSEKLAGIVVPFGAAASPDLTILPVFAAAAAVGASTAVVSLLAFALATVGTIVALTLLAAFGGYRLRARWLERWGNALTAAVLVVIGALVAAGVI